MKSLYIRAVEVVQQLTVKYCDVVISPSVYSSSLFKTYYRGFKGKNLVAPLLIPDYKAQGNLKKEFFSIIGTAHKATGHDKFVELVNYVAEKGYDFRFAVISSSNLKPFIGALSEKGKKLIEIKNNSIVSDQEINDIALRSYAVFRLDTEVTQSGVIPVSYMNNAPIIARDIPGLSQHVDHKVNGFIVPFDCSPETLVEAMAYVRENIEMLSRNARCSYEEVWAAWNFDKYYQWLIDLL